MANQKKKSTSRKKNYKGTVNKESVKSTRSKTGNKTSSSKKTTTKKTVKKVVKKENFTVSFDDIQKQELPKLKSEDNLEVNQNLNKASKVISTEQFTVIKNNKVNTCKNKKNKSYNKIISLFKKNNVLKKLNSFGRRIKIYGIPKKYLFSAIIIIGIILLLNLSIFFFKNPSSSFDMSDVPSVIDTLTTVNINLDDVDTIVSNKTYFDGLKNYDRYDFDSVFKLNSDYVDKFSIKYSEVKKQLLFIIKPTDNNFDNVKNTITTFLKENKISDYTFTEYDGYMIFVKAKNRTKDSVNNEKNYNAEVIRKLKQTKVNVFNLLLDLKKDDIESTFNISPNLYSDAIVKVARLKSDTCGYAIFKPTSLFAKNKIISQMNEYYKNLEEKWNDNEENKELVQNRYFEEYEGYLVYIVSHNNKLVMELIESN